MADRETKTMQDRYDKKYVLDIKYDSFDSTENTPAGRAEEENPRDYSLLLQDQDPFSDSNKPSADTSEAVDVKLEASLYDTEEDEKDPYWFPIVYPDHTESEAQDQNNEVPSDQEIVKQEPVSETMEEENLSGREGLRPNRMDTGGKESENRPARLIVPPRLPEDEEPIGNAEGIHAAETETHDGLKDIIAGLEEEKSNRIRAGDPLKNGREAEMVSGINRNKASYADDEDLPQTGYVPVEERESGIFEDEHNEDLSGEYPEKETGNTGAEDTNTRNSESKDKNGTKWGRAAPNRILFILVTVILLGLSGTVGYMFFVRTPKPDLIDNGYNNLTIDTAAAEEHETVTPVSARNVYFAGIDNSTCNGDTIVYLENLPENEDFLMKYEIYTLTEDGQRKDMVYETDLIPSGKHVNWKPAQDLGVGIHQVAFVEQPFMQSGEDYIPLTAGENQVVLTIVE